VTFNDLVKTFLLSGFPVSLDTLELFMIGKKIVLSRGGVDRVKEGRGTTKKFRYQFTGTTVF